MRWATPLPFRCSSQCSSQCVLVDTRVRVDTRRKPAQEQVDGECTTYLFGVEGDGFFEARARPPPMALAA